MIGLDELAFKNAKVIEDDIQALKTGDANKALLDLNEAHNGLNQQLAN
jgi:hypothetical protein